VDLWVSPQKKKEPFWDSFFMFCAFSRFARFACLARKQKSEAFLLRSAALRNKPDSVEDSHLSGMIVANHLKRFKLDYWKLETRDWKNQNESPASRYPASSSPEYDLARR